MPQYKSNQGLVVKRTGSTLIVLLLCHVLVGVSLSSFASRSTGAELAMLRVLAVCCIYVPALCYIWYAPEKCLTKQKVERQPYVWIYAPVFFLCATACNLFLNLFSISIPRNEPSYSGMAWSLLFMATSVLPALFEEVIFRGYIQSSFSAYGRRFSVMFTALLFALFHTPGTATFAALILGVLLGYIQSKTGSLPACILLHLGNNTIAFVLLLLQAGNMYVAAERFLVIIFVIALMSSLATIPLLCKSIKKFSKAEEKQVRLPVASLLKSPEVAVGLVGFLSYFLLRIFAV